MVAERKLAKKEQTYLWQWRSSWLLLLRVLVVVAVGECGVVALIAFAVIGLIRGFVVVCGCFAQCVVW